MRAVGVALVLLLGIELGIRVAYLVRNSMVSHVVIPYTAAQDFGPVPPWIDGLRILESAAGLSWRNQPNVRRSYLDVYGPVRFEEDRARLLRRFIPNTPAYLEGNPVWTVSVNSRGFRGPEFETAKAPGAFRIVCIGDSWTFGANVDQSGAYPHRLEGLLRSEYPAGDVEVLNLGVMGYSSYQGLELLQTEGLPLEPDLVIIGFGMNDALVGGWRDKDSVEPEATVLSAARIAAGRLEIVKLLRYVSAEMRHEPWSIGDYMQTVASSMGTPDHAWSGGAAAETTDYEAAEPYTRVSPRDYEENIRAMVRLAKNRGATVILLYNSIWDTPYRDALERVSLTESVPLVDSESVLDRAVTEIEQDIERSRGLEPPSSRNASSTGSDQDSTEVVFRVFAGDQSVSEALYIAGTDPALGNAIPNVVSLRDDGAGGDQTADDDVWSLAVSLPPGRTVLYVYTNSGEAGRWEGMDVPDLRRLTVPSDAGGGRVYGPIETFGRFYLQADGWHTDAAGYTLIAEAVLEVIRSDAGLHARLARPGG